MSTITINTKALNKMNWTWESLYFPNNDIKIASIEDKDFYIELTTAGKVKILDSYLNTLTSQQIIDALKNNINIDLEYNIINNNWFSIELYDSKKNLLEDAVFENCPKDYNDLVKSLQDWYYHYIEIYR